MSTKTYLSFGRFFSSFGVWPTFRLSSFFYSNFLFDSMFYQWLLSVWMILRWGASHQNQWKRKSLEAWVFWEKFFERKIPEMLLFHQNLTLLLLLQCIECDCRHRHDTIRHDAVRHECFLCWIKSNSKRVRILFRSSLMSFFDFDFSCFLFIE